jgi:hypothetical protein
MHVPGATAAAVKAKEPAAPIQRVDTPHDVFDRDYLAAFVARDGVAMRAAIDALIASGAIGQYMHAFDPARTRFQIAMLCARIRGDAMRAADASFHAVTRERNRQRAAGKRDGRICQSWRSPGSFKDIGRVMREQAEKVAQLATLEGFRADEAREIVPVRLDDGTKAFVRFADLADPNRYGVDLVKANGEAKRSRRSGTYVSRSRIACVIQPVARRAAAPVAVDTVPTAPAADVAALQAQVEALAATVASLVAAAAIVAPAAPVADPAPVAAVDGTDARDAYIATLLAERAELTDRAEAAEAMSADLQRIAERETSRADAAEARAARVGQDATSHHVRRLQLQDKRRRTASRLVTARAAARTARREAIGHQTAYNVAATELQRLQPLAAALAALIPAAAPLPTGGNVVPLHAAA